MGRRGLHSKRISCFNCGGPHLRRIWTQLEQGIMMAGAAQTRQGRSPTRKATFSERLHRGTDQ